MYSYSLLPKQMWHRPDTGRTFHFKQFNLPVDSSGITGHTSVCANDPMARYDERNGIMTDSTAHGLGGHPPNPFQFGNTGSYFAVSHCLTERNSKQYSPDSHPEWRRVQCQCRGKTRVMPAEVNVKPLTGLRKDRKIFLLNLIINVAGIILLSVKPQSCQGVTIT